MTARTLTRTATALTLASVWFTALAQATPTDPSRALLGQVDSKYPPAIVTGADPAGPSGADALLNQSGSLVLPAVGSQIETAEDQASHGLLGRT